MCNDHTPELQQTKLPLEEWRDIPGYKGLYQISSQGQVRRLSRRITTKNGHKQTHHGKNKKLGLRNGYHYVWLFKKNQGEKWYVHALVALAFLGPRPTQHQIHHKNENRLDNQPENLMYIPEKTHNSYHHQGEKHHFSALTRKDVIAIRELYKTMPVHLIAKQLDLPYHAVWQAAKRRSWKHIT